MSDNKPMPGDSADAGVYPIRTVSALTGVNPVTLRAWERRYGLIRPHRTNSGRRVYSRADIDLIHRILALTHQGVAIGRVAEALASEADAPPDPWQRTRERMLTAILSFDSMRLEDVYDELIALHPVREVTREVLVPLLHELGRRWADGDGRVADEHFFSVFLRNKLGARLHYLARRSEGPQLIAACLPGEQHELGLLLFSLAASERGYQVLVLGASMPLGELPLVARALSAQAIILAGSLSEQPPQSFRHLAHLVASTSCPVLVGGAVTAVASDEIAHAGAHALGEDFDLAVDKLAQYTA